jgi:hypothetical protein
LAVGAELTGDAAAGGWDAAEGWPAVERAR